MRCEADGMILRHDACAISVSLGPRAALLLLLSAALLGSSAISRARRWIPRRLPVSLCRSPTLPSAPSSSASSRARSPTTFPINRWSCSAPARRATVRTDASGRAEFAGLPPGARVTAVATVARRATAVAGVRRAGERRHAPAARGDRSPMRRRSADRPDRARCRRSLERSVLGDQSRFVFEFGDGSLSVFNILQIVNTVGRRR